MVPDKNKPQTVAQKILAYHCGKEYVKEGEIVNANVDLVLGNDITMPLAIGEFKKIGVKSDTYTSCKYKDILSGGRPEKPGERAIIQGHINKVYKAFIQIVADGRPELTVKQLENSIMTDGRIFLGSEALKLKLIDQIGFFEDGVELAAKLSKLHEYRVVAYKKKFSLAALFDMKSGVQPANINVKLLGKDKSMIEAGKFYYMPIQ